MISDKTIYAEMTTHPALFTHSNPRVIGIIAGNKNHSIVEEILKHHAVERIYIIDSEEIPAHPIIASASLNTIPAESLDILITDSDFDQNKIQSYFHLLQPNGILVQKACSAFVAIELAQMYKIVKTCGFQDIRTLSIPQPEFVTGWLSIFLAKKHKVLRKIREKDIFNKTFKTIYYNFDVHKAALAMPEFMKTELLEEV